MRHFVIAVALGVAILWVFNVTNLWLGFIIGFMAYSTVREWSTRGARV